MFNHKTLLATADDGLIRARCDRNGNWSVEQLLDGEPVRCIASVPGNPDTIYAGTQRRGVLRSSDGGQTWQPAGLVGHIVKALAANPREPGVLYAGTKPPGVFVTRDAGATWTELETFREIRGYRLWRSPAEPPDWRAYVSALSVSPTDPHVLVAGIEFGAVVRSQDGGHTWSNHRKGAIRDCHELTFHATHGEWVYQAGASLAGAAVSQDGGVTWQQPKEDLKHHYGWACAADPERPDVWYLSAGPMGWRGKPQAHKDGQANAAIYRCTGGAAWERLGGGLPEPMTHLAYALMTGPAAPGHLYAALSSGEVWHTADYGDSWGRLPFNLGSFHGKMILV